jgi:hypothetical protein
VVGQWCLSRRPGWELETQHEKKAEQTFTSPRSLTSMNEQRKVRFKLIAHLLNLGVLNLPGYLDWAEEATIRDEVLKEP